MDNIAGSIEECLSVIEALTAFGRALSERLSQAEDDIMGLKIELGKLAMMQDQPIVIQKKPKVNVGCLPHCDPKNLSNIEDPSMLWCNICGSYWTDKNPNSFER